MKVVVVVSQQGLTETRSSDQQDADPVQRLHELHQQRLMWAQLANNQAGTARSTTSAGVKAQGHVALASSDADNGAVIPVFSSSST